MYNIILDLNMYVQDIYDTRGYKTKCKICTKQNWNYIEQGIHVWNKVGFGQYQIQV